MKRNAPTVSGAAEPGIDPVVTSVVLKSKLDAIAAKPTSVGLDCPVPGAGYWCRPTLFTGVSQSSRVVQEEIFGPVLAIQTFRTFQEALDKTNNTPYGLSGGVWTDKGAKIFRMTRAIRAGVVWANTFNKFDPAAPFGGYKESGIGREGGLHGLDAYVELT